MKLYYVPISPYAQKVMMALYEKEISFTPELVNLMDKAARKKYRELYPIGKVPLLVLEDDYMIPESSIIVEYIDQNYPKDPLLIPGDPQEARKVRFKDRMLDLYMTDSVMNLFFQSRKSEAEKDTMLVKQSQQRITAMFEFLNHELDDNGWLHGIELSLADCAAAPALFFCQQLFPFDNHPKIQTYAERLLTRPSFQKVAEEAIPFLSRM